MKATDVCTITCDVVDIYPTVQYLQAVAMYTTPFWNNAPYT